MASEKAAARPGRRVARFEWGQCIRVLLAAGLDEKRRRDSVN